MSLMRAVVIAALVGVLAAPAAAAGPRLLLDRAELEPSAFAGLARLRLHVSAVQLEGALIEIGGADPFVLTINGARRREPYLAGRHAASGAATAVIVVVETGWEMRDEMDAIGGAVRGLLS